MSNLIDLVSDAASPYFDAQLVVAPPVVANVELCPMLLEVSRPSENAGKDRAKAISRDKALTALLLLTGDLAEAERLAALDDDEYDVAAPAPADAQASPAAPAFLPVGEDAKEKKEEVYDLAENGQAVAEDEPAAAVVAEDESAAAAVSVVTVEASRPEAGESEERWLARMEAEDRVIWDGIAKAFTEPVAKRARTDDGK